MRRTLLCLLAVAALAAGQSRPTTPPDQESLRKRAIARGLVHLKRQQAVDGSFGGHTAGRIGISSLSLLAFLASGHQENRGPYGDVLRKGVNFLLRRSLPAITQGKPKGYITLQGDSDSRMHGHGYATQVLLIAYGTGGNAARASELRNKIRLAVGVIEDSQTMTGGWGYEPNDRSFHEGSVTVTVVQALRLARDAGFVIDNEVVTRGLKYLKQSQKSNGAFKYALLEPRSSAALTAAAITTLHAFGKYYGDSIKRGLEYLETSYRDRDGLQWPFYANYYAAQAFHHAGGGTLRMWHREIVPQILSSQRRSHWDDRWHARAPGTRGPTYATAMSCLALSVSDGYLPLFQR